MISFRSLIIILSTTVFVLLEVSAQETLPHKTFQTVQLQNSEYHSYHSTEMFELKNGNFLFVYYGLNKAVSTFLFDSNGNYLKGNAQILKGNKEIYSLKVFEVGDKVILLTHSNESKMSVAHLWDITEADKAEMIAEMSFIKSKDAVRASAVISPDGNWLAVIGPCFDKVVLLHNLKIHSERAFLEKADDRIVAQNILDNMAVDNEGNIALSIFFKEGITTFKSLSGSWAIIGLGAEDSKFRLFNVPEIFIGAKSFVKDVSSLSSTANGNFVFTYVDSGKLFVAIIDVPGDKIEVNLGIDCKKLIASSTGGFIERISAAELINSNTLALVYEQGYAPKSAASGVVFAGSRGLVLVNINDEKIVSGGNMTPLSGFDYMANYQLSKGSDGNYCIVTYFAHPDMVKFAQSDQIIDDKLIKKYKVGEKSNEHLLYLVINDMKTNSNEYFKCYHDTKVKLDDKKLLLTNKGTAVVAEFNGKKMTLHVHN